MENRNSKKSLEQPLEKQFILHQNAQLRQQLAEMRQILQHNKRALRATLSSSNLHQQKLVMHLYEQNECLRTQLNKRQIECQNSLSNILINQQIVKASQDHQKSVIQELNSKVIDLRRQLRDREKKMLQLQKIHPTIDPTNALQIQLQEVTNPSVLAVKMNDDIQYIREQLTGKIMELENEKQSKQQALKLNIILSRQIEELKASLIIPSLSTAMNSVDGYRDQNRNRFSEILQFHHSILHPIDTIDEEDSYSQVEVQIENIKPPEPKKKVGIPKLQLLKAKQIQQLIVKNMFQQDKIKTVTSAKQVNHLKSQVQILKKCLNRQMLKSIQLQRTIDNLNRVNKQLEQRNKLLTKSNNHSSNISPPQSFKPTTPEISLKHQQSHIQQVANIGRAVYLNNKIEMVVANPKIFTTLKRQRSTSTL